MNDQEIRERLMSRLLAAQSPWGRARLNAYVRWKRISWQVVLNATLFLKRALDVVFSLLAILLLTPVYAVVALLVKQDGGPVLFRQTRIGLNGREFKMLKFRSMCVDAEARLKDLLAKNEMPAGVTFKMKDDPRITKIGRFLRRSSLDELPQFWNVLAGDMSLVGPRPPVPREVALYTQADRRRFLVKPGITCLWQVGERQGGLLEIGNRHAIDFPEQVSLDVRYIESQSFWKDVVILLKTIPAILFGKGMG
jgi:lipopolysaccharide/colanic/teichoic acid biosynthesis glycosyltransferase